MFHPTQGARPRSPDRKPRRDHFAVCVQICEGGNPRITPHPVRWTVVPVAVRYVVVGGMATVLHGTHDLPRISVLSWIRNPMRRSRRIRALTALGFAARALVNAEDDADENVRRTCSTWP